MRVNPHDQCAHLTAWSKSAWNYARECRRMNALCAKMSLHVLMLLVVKPNVMTFVLALR